jgi:putative transcriptional regulator
MINNLKAIRQEQGLLQEQLAEQVQVSRQTIISIEKCHYFPSTILALKIAKVLNKKVEEIFTLEKKDWL